ncbi:MAG: oligosaccharide flippase family protein [Firmicutes bacterium]|nr:oligosaccharide flippase family protein [Bacillota bacterium]
MKRLIKAVLIVTVFTLVDRVMGFGFKIYLSRELGAINMGIYQIALSVFFVLITFTTSGVPLVVSKLTAVFRKKGDLNSERGVVAAALIVGVASSGALCGIFLLFSKPIGGLFASFESMNLLLLLLPGVFFSGIYAAFRGNMWGNERYTAVSVFEVIEQIARIGLCVLLFLLGFNKLHATALTLSLACGVTAVLCAAYYFKTRKRLANPKPHLKPLLKTAGPITMIRASNTLVSSLIALAVPFLLVLSGLSSAESLAVFGSSIGMALPLLYLPVTVVGSLAYVMIPTLSAAHADGDVKSVRAQIESALTFSCVVAAVFIPAFTALGEPLGAFIYKNGGPEAGRFLALSGWLLIPIALESISSSMMNSLNLEKRSFVNYLIGASLMFGLMFGFWKSFRIEVLSVGLGLSWTVSTVLNILSIKKKTGIKLSFLMPLVKCIALIIPATALTAWVYTLASPLPAALKLSLAGFAGLGFFGALSLVFGIFDVSLIFKGRARRKNNPERRKNSPPLQM